MNINNKTKTTASEFVKKEMLKVQNRLFCGRILFNSIGYLIITLWLNSVRATMWIWFLWVIIIIQFALYFSIFIRSYQRSKAFGLNQNFAFLIFVVLAILGRVNDWELLIIPLLVVTMLILSIRNQKTESHKKESLKWKKYVSSRQKQRLHDEEIETKQSSKQKEDNLLAEEQEQRDQKSSEKLSGATKSAFVNRMLQGKSFQILGQSKPREKLSQNEKELREKKTRELNELSRKNPERIEKWLEDSEQIREEGESVD